MIRECEFKFGQSVIALDYDVFDAAMGKVYLDN